MQFGRFAFLREPSHRDQLFSCLFFPAATSARLLTEVEILVLSFHDRGCGDQRHQHEHNHEEAGENLVLIVFQFKVNQSKIHLAHDTVHDEDKCEV